MSINDSYFLNPAHLEIARARYFLKDENGQPIEKDIEEVFIRVVDFIFQKQPEYKETAFRLRKEKKILDAGRILAQAGTSCTNLLNCFVIGFEEDSREAISDLKKRHLNIQAFGGGTGINFGTLRPRGSICKTSQSISSGAVGFITDFSYQSANVSQGGNRSGANLGVLPDWHPDLLEFITYKSRHNWENVRRWASVLSEDEFAYFQWNNPYPWQTFNVSVLISDKFMSQVEQNSKDPWILRWKDQEWPLWDFINETGPRTGQIHEKRLTVTAPNEQTAFYKAGCEVPFFNTQNMKLIKGPYHLSAQEWFTKMAQGAWQDGCPGILFIDRARAYHNGEYCDPIEAANPCGEQLLPRNGVCCLTNLILPSFLKEDGEIDWKELEIAIQIAVRGLDQIIDLTSVKDELIDTAIKRTRRIGLGTTGVAELLIQKKLKYSSSKGRKFIADILEFIRNTAYKTSIQLAREFGPFELFDRDKISQSRFFQTLPKKIQKDIREFGLRNVTLLTQPPVGTTGTIVGYSTGGEPYPLPVYKRNSRVGSFNDGSPTFLKWLEENNIDPEEWDSQTEIKVPDYFECAHSISPKDHISMMCVFSSCIDSSVSKTVNLNTEATVEQVLETFLEAYRTGVIKSLTVYRDGSKQQIIEKIKEDRPTNIPRAHAPSRPKILDCDIHHTSIKGEKWTVLVGLHEGKPYEVFCAPQDSFELSNKWKQGKIVKKSKGNYLLDMEDFKLKDLAGMIKTDEHRVITRLLSTALRHGVPITFINQQLAKAEGSVVDFSKAVLRVLKKYKDEFSEEFGGTCPNCGSEDIMMLGGCLQCPNCNYSKCE